MEESGLTFGSVKDVLRVVVDNGVCEDDPRVMTSTNQAQMELLIARDPTTGQTIIPVGAMATFDITAVGTELFLPKELRNVIYAEVLGTSSVRSKHYIRRGGYDMVNPFTYVDPNLAQDNPLVDLGFFPDPGDSQADPVVPPDPTVRRRKYDYPGLQENAIVRVTGERGFVPITEDEDYLIVQNVPALELMIIALWHRKNNDRDGAKAYKADAVELLVDEIKAFQIDPRQSLKRKADYEADLANLPPDSFGHYLARLAFELPGGLHRAKSDLVRELEASEQRLMSKMHAVGTLEEFQADVEHGRILAPDRVKTIVAADLCGQPLDIRNIFFQYQKNGPGRDCAEMLIDEGEFYDTKKKKHYRQYRLGGEDMTQYFPRTAVTSTTTQGEQGPPGAAGAPGSVWRSGTSNPDNSLGSDNDVFFNTVTFDLFQKVSGAYILLGNLKGPEGESSMEAMTLNLDALTGGGSTNLDGVDVDALGIGLEDARIVTIAGQSAIYQVKSGVPDVNDVAVLNHNDWHWQRTL